MSRTSSMQQVVVVPYQADWRQWFESESDKLLDLVRDLTAEIYHIGSTSIPGMAAKPIVDMLLSVPEVTRLDARASNFESLGYEVMGEYGIPGRRYFRKNDEEGIRRFHLHAFSDGSADVIRHLRFRDYLRATPDRAAQYATLKIELARRFPDDIEHYMDGKDGLIKQLEQEAAAWQP